MTIQKSALHRWQTSRSKHRRPPTPGAEPAPLLDPCAGRARRRRPCSASSRASDTSCGTSLSHRLGERCRSRQQHPLIVRSRQGYSIRCVEAQTQLNSHRGHTLSSAVRGRDWSAFINALGLASYRSGTPWEWTTVLARPRRCSCRRPISSQRESGRSFTIVPLRQ